MIVSIIAIAFLYMALDWKYLEYKYGIKIFPDELLQWTHHDGSVSTVIMMVSYSWEINKLIDQSRPRGNQYVNIKYSIL